MSASAPARRPASSAAPKPGSKDAALLAIADALEAAEDTLRAANHLDMEAGRASGLEPALLDRLELTPKGIRSMAQGLREIAAQTDPVGEITDLKYRPSGIQVGRMRVPLGVIGIIYESRPNVTADAAALCLKSGNAAILRGGSEALHSNRAIAACIQQGLAAAGLPADAVQVIDTADRAAVGELIRMAEYVDVIVPRGGKGLIERISREARVPVIKHLDGVCHVYIDDRADLDKAVSIAYNAKTQRYGTCNTMETLLVAEGIAEQVLPELGRMYREAGVELRGCAANPRPAARHQGRHRGRLVRRISGADSGGAGGQGYGRGHGSYRHLRFRPHRCHRHRGLQPGAALSARGGFQFGDGERLHPLRRRRGVRAGRGNRHQHRQAARAGAGRRGGFDHLEIRGAGRRSRSPLRPPL